MYLVERVSEILKPYDYYYLVASVGIPGPGNIVVTFATQGDFYTACINARGKVLWCHTCGGTGE